MIVENLLPEVPRILLSSLLTSLRKRKKKEKDKFIIGSMNEQDHTEKLTFGNLCLRFIQGMLLGFLNGVPLFQIQDLKETLGFRKEREMSTFKSIKERFLFLLLHRSTYLIGGFLGFLLFFYIPVLELTTDYPTAIYAGIGAMSIGFAALEVYRFVRARKKTINYIRSAILFVLSFLVLLLCGMFSQEPDFLHSSTYLFYFFLFVIASFILSFSGLSLMTLVYFMNNAILLSDSLRNLLYEHKNVGLLFVLLFAVLIGYTGYQFFDHFYVQKQKRLQGRFSLAAEKHALNFGIYLASFFLSFAVKMHAPYYTGITKEYVELITILTSAFAGFFVSIGLTIHGYRQLNREDYRELNSLPLPKGGDKR